MVPPLNISDTSSTVRHAASGVAVGLLTAAFLLRGLFLAIALPYGDPLDERYHFAYADFIAETGRLPREHEGSVPFELARGVTELPRSTATGGRRIDWGEWRVLPPAEKEARRRSALSYHAEDRGRYAGPNYETQQAPLVYEVGAGVLRMMSGASVSVRLLALRLLSVVVASIAVPFAFLFFRELFPASAALAATAAFVAYPGSGTFTGRYTNDAFAFPLGAALAVLLGFSSTGDMTRRRGVLLAAVLAAGLWTKLYFLPLLAAAPLAALFSPRQRRGRTFRLAIAVVAIAGALILPWLARQRAETGDWLGLNETKAARRAGRSVGSIAATIPEAASLRVAGNFTRSHIFPGTWAMTGAPRVPAAIALAGIAAIVVGAVVGRRRRATAGAPRRWAGGGIALAIFFAAQVAHEAGLAVAFGWKIGAAAGWYALILLPVAIALPAVSQRAPSMAWLAATGCFLAAEAILMFGALPAAYAGVARLGARSPWSTYAGLLFSPGEALRTYASVSLVAAPSALLGVLAALWIAMLLAALAVASRVAAHERA